MNMSWPRAWRDVLLAVALATTALTVLASASFTPDERKFVATLPALFQSQCEQGTANAQREQTPEARETTSDWVKAVSGPQGACACITAQVMAQITPELLRSRDGVERVTNLVADAGASCMASAMRTTFPAICPETMRRNLAGKGLDDVDSYVPGLCRCMQVRIDALTPAQLRPYMRAIIAREVSPAASAPATPSPLPSSFDADMRECAYATANQIFDDQIAAAKAARAAAAASAASQAQ